MPENFTTISKHQEPKIEKEIVSKIKIKAKVEGLISELQTICSKYSLAKEHLNNLDILKEAFLAQITPITPFSACDAIKQQGNV